MNTQKLIEEMERMRNCWKPSAGEYEVLDMAIALVKKYGMELGRELELAERPWTVELCYNDGNNPFAREQLKILDIGVADHVLVVESALVKKYRADNDNLIEKANNYLSGGGCGALSVQGAAKMWDDMNNRQINYHHEKPEPQQEKSCSSCDFFWDDKCNHCSRSNPLLAECIKYSCWQPKPPTLTAGDLLPLLRAIVKGYRYCTCEDESIAKIELQRLETANESQIKGV